MICLQPFMFPFSVQDFPIVYHPINFPALRCPDLPFCGPFVGCYLQLQYNLCCIVTRSLFSIAHDFRSGSHVFRVSSIQSTFATVLPRMSDMETPLCPILPSERFEGSRTQQGSMITAINVLGKPTSLP